MSLFVIGDLHLSYGADKPMDIFGGAWEGFAEKLDAAWRETVAPEDTVVLCGDSTWGISLAEALPDFKYIDSLPGKKYLLKGNHDYYWDTVSKMRRFLAENGLSSLDFIHNSFAAYGDTALCGTKGWFADEEEGHDRKIYLREVGRLRESLSQAEKAGFKKKRVFLHYPPVSPLSEYPEITGLMREYGVSDCYYGHLHGPGLRNAVTGLTGGIEYHCVSADYVKFTPQKII